jgi:hypothetical protein
VEAVTRYISVVTAVHGPSMKFLPEAYESLAGQHMPAGWVKGATSWFCGRGVGGWWN